MFERKATRQLREWKEKYSGKYAALLEGARRVGKTTIAEAFAREHYRSYLKIDFANITREMLSVFDDIADLDFFFLRLQAAAGVTLYPHESALIFDEIQLAPKVRQAIKYLTKDGRYDYIETGSLISIKKNVKNIVIPSEEYRISVFPMDYEEFLAALRPGSYDTLRAIYQAGKPVGSQLNTRLMRDFRLYMATGGMPQAVAAYAEGKNFEEIDFVKREILALYRDDFRKIDASGRIGRIFSSIPGRLALGRKRFVLSSSLQKRVTDKDRALFSDLLDSKTVLACHAVSDPGIALPQTMDPDIYKLYLCDTGLFTTMLFSDESGAHAQIYSKLLSDKLEANLGYLYENAAAQMIAASGRSLFYHTWRKEGSTRDYEVDFLLPSGTKIAPFEIKSSGLGAHESILAFSQKYSRIVSRPYLFSQKDAGHREALLLKPMYLLPFVLEDLGS